jgi:hypothetical protein
MDFHDVPADVRRTVDRYLGDVATRVRATADLVLATADAAARL